MMRSTFMLLLAAFATAGPTGFGADAIVIGVADARSEPTAGRADDAVRRGIEFGVHEMAQTARLLGREVRLAEGPEPLPYGWVAIGEQAPRRGVPVIQVARLPAAPGPCDFAIGLTDVAADEVLWHPTLNRFGASELNERFVRRYETGMTEEAWAGWVAVKALVESALRRRPDENPCAALQRLRFDGHKGRPLYFEAASRMLIQPKYVLENGRVTGERQ